MRQHAPGMGHQGSKQAVLDRREVYRDSVARNTPFGQIERHGTEMHQRLLLLATPVPAPQLCPDSREQLRYAKRLGEVIVGAGIERAYFGLFVSARRQYD